MTAFNSFFIGRLEGSNVDIVQKYRDLLAMGITTTREDVCWISVECAANFDFSSLKTRIDVADQLGIQIVWDLCSKGFPEGLSPQSVGFSDRFAAYCAAFANFYSDYSSKALFVVPIADITFLSWHAHEHRANFSASAGFNLKYHLCKAAIKGINSLRRANPQCRIVMVEPLIRVHAGSYTEAEQLFELNEAQFQAMDIIAGRLYPELGGSEGHLDILGFNYSSNSQWEEGGKPLPWPEVFERRVPLSSLLKMVANRYDRPIWVAETCYLGGHQFEWVEEITNECLKAIDHGVQLQGLCISLSDNSHMESEYLNAVRSCIRQTDQRLEEMALPLSASAFG